MSTTFPTTVDTFDVAIALDADVYANLIALQTKLGVDSSADTTSIDYKIRNLITGASIAAAGATQGTATPITTDTVQVSASFGQNGVILDTSLPGYARIFVDFTGGIATLSIYPPVGGQINGLGTNNPTSLATGAQIEVWSVKSDNTQWYTR